MMWVKWKVYVCDHETVLFIKKAQKGKVWLYLRNILISDNTNTPKQTPNTKKPYWFHTFMSVLDPFSLHSLRVCTFSKKRSSQQYKYKTRQMHSREDTLHKWYNYVVSELTCNSSVWKTVQHMCWLKSGAHHWLTAPCRPIKNKCSIEQYKVRKKRKNHPTTHQEYDEVRHYTEGRAGRKQRCSLADNGRCECTIMCNVWWWKQPSMPTMLLLFHVEGEALLWFEQQRPPPANSSW